MPTPAVDRSARSDIKRFTANYRAEVDGVALYRSLEDAEQNPALRELYGRLATTEEHHLDLWRRKLTEAGAALPPDRPSFRVRSLGWFARRFGTAFVAPIVVQMEQGGTDMYDGQPEAMEHGLPADERSHARVFRQLSRSTWAPEAGGAIARIEGRHRFANGNALRAAVLGLQDGLISVFCLLAAVAGADPGRAVVVTAGVGAVVAGAFSMALGEWVSVKSSAEAFNRQLEIERAELEFDPEEEAEELALIYQAKGLPRDEARATAQRILANRETALDTLAREELGMSASEAGSAWVAAFTSFALFVVAGIIPVIPWFIGGGWGALIASGIAAGAALYLAGGATALFTGRSMVFSGSRMLVLGMAGAAITYGVGYLVGAGAGV
jgi:VIT1/CCC1 family predicted Fe2+/Mn2+ transporter